jgi:uncharacterized repeat protein (TIGR03803 family)
MAMSTLRQYRSLISQLSLTQKIPALALAIITLVLGIFTTQSARAQTFTVLYGFTGGKDGNNPYAGPILDAAGKLYGTTQYGGTFGQGTVFEVDTTGAKKVLHSFKRAQGAVSRGSLTRDSAGNLYGTASEGGANGCDGQGCGTVFKLSRGKLTVLHYFIAYQDGTSPWAGLVRDSSGNLYGTTLFDSPSGNGTVFKINKSGKETLLYTFNAEKSGRYPYGSLIRDPAGNLYGTTSAGGFYGTGDCSLGCGTVFKLTPAGKYTVLYQFSGGPDGYKPLDGLVRDSAGNLYGTTELGGTSEQGTIFKVTKTGAETVLYSFTGGADGAYPRASLVRDSAANLYGAAAYGGDGGGTIFKMGSTGSFTVLHTFAGAADGANPFGGLAMDAAGNLYGTAETGGTSGFGTVFKITP